MKKYTEMGYSEFMSEMDEYIATLKQGEALTETEWISWIKGEAKDHDEELTDEQIGWIVEKLDDDGFVKEEGKTMTYLLKLRDEVIGRFGTPFPTDGEALTMCGYTIGDEEELIDEDGEYTGKYLEECGWYSSSDGEEEGAKFLRNLEL